MITTVEIAGPATFSTPAVLTTDKKINLIYGLNGTGKSTVCRFLKNPQSTEFNRCSISPPQSRQLYVYNEEFIQENFYESDTVKGIFSLSKENKDAERHIEATQKARANHVKAQTALEEKRTSKGAELQRAKNIAEGALWEIKTNYTGGDRVLEYCLEGLRAKKESLFNHLLLLPKPTCKPDYSVALLKLEAQALTEGDTPEVAQLSRIVSNEGGIETDEVFEVPIIGNQNSTVSALIQKLGNSDWVREGLNHVQHNANRAGQCPFCQAETITQELVGRLRDFFDESYEKAIRRVRDHLTAYETYTNNILQTTDLTTHPFATQKLALLCEKLHSLLAENTHKIRVKSQTPSTTVHLDDSSPLICDINLEVDEINSRIDSHNRKLRNKSKALAEIKTKFWDLMRSDYDKVIARYLKDKGEVESALQAIDAELRDIHKLIVAADTEISEAQKGTVNIDEAIENINQALLDLGIDDFSVERHDEALYRLKRNNNRGSSKFSTLSEGEKMIITLLYFCELCKGRQSALDTHDDKIVVFDDPISSLSHIYVFNVGDLIRSTFFKTNVAKQIFVFTHSLYFFYELAKPKKRNQDEDEQALFRITKSKGQSHFTNMKYHEIQNDYQAYWQVVNDSTQHPALIANCMRNIIDYFFGFVEKLDFASVFQKPTLKDNRFQAFCRYMNRESHSFGQNIYDLKEFDYAAFKDGLRLVFEESNYREHYRKMSRI